VQTYFMDGPLIK